MACLKKEDIPGVNGDKENCCLPILSLAQFSRAPFVTFGAVQLGSSKSTILRIENHSDDGATDVTVDRISSTRGFSVGQNRFKIEPGDGFDLTITWTPTEEGGVRELIIFLANGVVRHQAILLGRAEAPKRKKKSLWDSIKNKKGADLSTRPRGRKTPSTLKKAANKTFHVSRNPQYKREQIRSPLSSLNEDVALRQSSMSSPTVNNYSRQLEQPQSFPPLVYRQRSQALLQGNSDENTPIVLLVPPAEIIDSSDAAAGFCGPGGTPECRDITRVLNRTHSPVGTPDRFKSLMPRIGSMSSPVVSALPLASDTALPGTSVLSVRDALVLIESDLTSSIDANPPKACSSFAFSDSLELENGNVDCATDDSSLEELPDSPSESDPTHPRLTFFIKPKLTVCQLEDPVAPPSCPPLAVEGGIPQVKRLPFTSATVIKSKAAPFQEISCVERKIKTSRRMLLEKTLEVPGGGTHSQSSPGTPGLPVIDSDISPDGDNSSITNSLFEVRHRAPEFTSIGQTPFSDHPAPAIFSLSPPPLRVPPTPQNPRENELTQGLALSELASAPVSVQPDSFPVHSQSQFDVMVRNKKRKSDEFMMNVEKVEDAETTVQVKRSRVSTLVNDPMRATQEKRSASLRLQLRTVGKKKGSDLVSVRCSSASSQKATKSVALAQAKQLSVRSAQGSQGLKSLVTSSVKRAKVVAVAQSKLTFSKPTQSATPRHPMPFAAKNMFYDERWVEKQERGFTSWMNYVLTPDDFKVNTEVSKVSAVSLAMGSDDKFSVPKAPTKDEMSLSTYTARRRLNRLRRAACHLFTSDAMVKAIQRLELEIETKRLLVRKDRHLWKDIAGASISISHHRRTLEDSIQHGMRRKGSASIKNNLGERQKVLTWLLSYNPLWLRIGLETIYGEMISLESNSDVTGLAKFILWRMLWNPDIAAEFRHAKVPNLYKDGHEEALSRFTLKKLLLLVCFLDKAKESRMIEHDPCLFCMDAEFKTSKDLLLAFSRDFLSGEGILPRHLGYLGLAVSHVQTPLDEFNYAVENLAVDLKCGIRLVRVMELFMQDWSLSRKLRMPAISRLQKVHNVDIALQGLRAKGVDLMDEHGAVIDSRDIVDGHREKTLSLLWKIIFVFQVEVLLDEEQLREEILFLKSTWSTKQKLASLRADQSIQQKVSKSWTPFEHSSQKITLLMEWVNAVCEFYNLRVENFTVSFSDGRVLCYLIHHYHPSHLPVESVCQSTSQTVECSVRGRVELNCSSSDSDNSFDTSPNTQNGPESPALPFKELLENEKNNFRLVNSAVSFLGGVPAMINLADMSNTIPNEKVVMSYLSFLCARLLDLRNETRAARVIQSAWRKYRLRKDLERFQERNVAAAKIQALVRPFLQRRRTEKRHSAAISIQAAWRGYAARNTLTLMRKAKHLVLKNIAATAIQAQWRRYIAMKKYQTLRSHVGVVQTYWRMKRAVSAYRKVQWAATTIQKHTRAWILARKERGNYLSLRSAAVKIQRNYRRCATQRLQKKIHAASVIQTAFRKWHKDKMDQRTAAALKIQSWFRMHKSLNKYVAIRQSAILVQAWYRGQAQRRNFQMLKLQHHSATIIQSAFRGSVVRKRMEKMRCASVIIQRRFRAFLLRKTERQTFLTIKSAVITIQAVFRRHMARRMIEAQHQAATVIQAQFRKFVAQRRFCILKRAVAVVQQQYRAKLLGEQSRKEYVALRCSALKIQAVWRGRVERKRIEKLHKYATAIQAYYRRHATQSLFRSRRAAALVIQQQFRAHKAGKEMRTEYLQVKKAVILLQAGLRGMRVRKELKERHQAATVIQTSVRAFICKRRYFLLQSAAIILQSHYRAHLVGKAQQQKYKRLKLATLKLQAAYQGYRVRRDLRNMHIAATLIQAQFRMYKMRVAYLATKCAVIIVQERYRANRLRDQQVQRYTAMKSAAVVMQAAYRGHRVRLEVAEMHKSATVIQRWFSTCRDRKRFLALKAAVLHCQQRYRAVATGRKDQNTYYLKRKAVITLQGAYRGMRVRQQLKTKRTAAITIQSHVRKHLHRTYYKRLLWAANAMQARYRANKNMTKERQSLNAKKNAVIVLQSALRGLQTRNKVKGMHKAAGVIQRGYWAHRERMQYLALRSSILTIQQRYRATMAAKQQMQRYQRMRNAAVLLQATYRGQQTRREISLQHQASTVIQAAFRRHREEVKFQAMRLSAIIIQRQYRSCIQRNQDRERFMTLRNSAVVIQAAFRGHCVRSAVAKMRRAATVIQANYRMHKQQSAFRRQCWATAVLQQRFRAQRQRSAQLREYQQMRKAVVLLQAAFRGMRSRQIIRKMHEAAGVIQRGYRAHLERMEYLALRSSVLTIQQRYRATMAAKQQMQHYQHMRNAAVLLQATYRGQQTRREITLQHQAATVIQAAFRRHREEVKFQAMRLSAIIIQRRYRSCIQRNQDRERFMTLRNSAVVIQAAFRGHCVRSAVAKMRRAATVIQANYRMYKQQSAFRRQCWATAVLQQRFRAQRQRSAQLREYQQMRKAVVLLQAAFRGMRSRQIVQKMHEAASVIQRGYRAHLERMEYLALRSSVLTIQQRYRATMAAKQQMQHYQRMRNAAVLLQATYRGQQTRREITLQHQAATVIQAAFRRHREVVKFQAMRLSAIIIQRQYRSCIQRNQDRERFMTLRNSAVVIQAAFRGHCVRSAVAKMRRAATVIQANYRMHKQQSAFRRQCWATTVLQQRFRAQRQRSAQLREYQQMRKAVVLLQAAFRGMRSRQIIRKMHEAAGVIQRGYRAHLERMEYLALRSSVLTIQQRYRATMAAKQQMQHYQRMRNAAVLLQATYRGQQTRREITLQHQAATVIQAAFRRHREEVKFQAMRLSAIIIQRRFRSCIQRNQDRERFMTLRNSAVVIQAAFRGHCVRSAVAKMRRAATVIQANYRMHKQQSAFRRQCWATAVLQQRFRAQRQRSAQLREYQQMRKAVVLLQAAFRGMRSRQIVRKMHEAAGVIQRGYRAHLERMDYLALRSSVLTIQQRYRATMAAKQQMQHYQRMRNAAVLLQATYRGQQTRREITLQHQAATVIQAAFRRHREEVKFQAMRLSAIILQRRYRSCIQRNQDRERFMTLRNSAVVIQAAFRRHCVRSAVAKMRRAATVIQANYRMHKQQSAFRRQCWAARVLQQRFRAQRQRHAETERYQRFRSAVICIQASFRGMKARNLAKLTQEQRVRNRFLAIQHSTLVIQRRWKETLKAQEECQKFLRMKAATVIIQAAWRGHRARRHLLMEQKAAVLIQSFYRGCVQREAYHRQRDAILLLQRRLRALRQARVERENFTRLRDSTITLQKHYRSWMVRRQLHIIAEARRRQRFSAAVLHHLCAIRIQRAIRARWVLQSAKKQIHSVIAIQRWLRARQQRHHYLKERSKVITAQRAARRWLANRHQAASVIQHATKKFLLLRRQQRVEQGIIKAQALWRGHCSRKLNDKPKMVAIRHRLRKVSVDVKEEDRLCNKTSTAIEYLLRYKHFSEILQALENLEIATRLSPECCETLVERGATQIIFTLIRSCNRSVPCMEIISYAIQVLLNLSKYNKTTEAVYAVEHSVDTLLDLLQIYREKAGDKVADKGGRIFTKACFLLVLLLQDQHIALEVKKVPKTLERIQSIYRITLRKHKMDEERTVQATPRKLKPVAKFAPDWVLRKDTPKDIVDPLVAIKMLVKMLLS